MRSGRVRVVVVCRCPDLSTGPGSEAVTSAFFDDLSETFDRVAGYCDPVYIVGDLNVRLDRTDDVSSQRLTELLGVYGFAVCQTGATRVPGGIIDVVATRCDLTPPDVTVYDVGLSDHHLLQWSVPMTKPSPPVVSVVCRPWHLLNVDTLRAVPVRPIPVGDERCCSAGVFCVAVRPYHPTPPTTALAEGAGASRVQACRPCLQVSAADSTIVPLRGIMPAGRLGGSTSSAVSLIIITGCPPYAVVYRRRSCFSGRRRTHLERSAAARHVCTLAACFSQSSEDPSLQTPLSVTPSSVFLSCL